MSRKVTILIFALLAAVSISAFVSNTSAISTNNCSCHSGRSESLGFLVGNAGNALPTTLNVGQTATVRVVLQHTVVGATLNNVINSVSASLASVSGHFSVSAPSVSLGSITGTGTVTATWTITGTSAGADSLRITASGANPHMGISFSDTYSPAPSINVVGITPPPPPPAAYTLTVTTVGSGTVTKNPNTSTYASGAVVQITATPAAGWSFSGWSGALTGTANPASITMDANKAVTATFTQNPPPQPASYTLTVTAVGGGSVAKTPNVATYTSGSVVQISATPADGWSFTSWSGGLTGSTNPASITVNSNLAVTATFTQNPPPPPPASTYVLTITTVGSGSVAKTPNTSTYASGAVVQITAMPSAGWSFAGWIGALTGTASSGSITMDANKAVTATFTQNLPPPPPTTPPTTSEDEDDDDRGYEPEHEDDDDREYETEHEYDGHRFHETEHDEDDHWSFDSYRSERNHCHDRD